MARTTVIRSADARDAPGVAELLAQLGYPSDPTSVAGRIERLARSEADRVLVAVKDGIVVGVLKLHIMSVLHEDACLCRLTALAVREGNHRQGIGRRLVESAEAIARERGCSRVEVTSAEHRLEAHEFYRRLGYQETSRRFIKKTPN